MNFNSPSKECLDNNAQLAKICNPKLMEYQKHAMQMAPKLQELTRCIVANSCTLEQKKEYQTMNCKSKEYLDCMAPAMDCLYQNAGYPGYPGTPNIVCDSDTASSGNMRNDKVQSAGLSAKRSLINLLSEFWILLL